MKTNEFRMIMRFVSAVAICLATAMVCHAFRAEDADQTSGPTPATPRRLGPSRSPSDTQGLLAEKAKQAGVKIIWNSQLGTPCCVRGRDLGQRQAFSGGKGLALRGAGFYKQDAVAVLDNLAGLFGIQDAETEFESQTLEQDTLGFHHVRLTQVHKELRVIGGQMIVHFNGKREVYEVNGNFVPDIDLDITARVSPTEAVVLAQDDLTGAGKPDGSLTQGPELVIFAFQAEPALAYELTLSYDRQADAGRWRYWIDARQGAVLLRFNDVKTISAPTTDGSHTTIAGSILSGEGGSSTTVTGWYENTGYFYLLNKTRYWYVYNVSSAGYTDDGTYAYRTSSDWGDSDRTEMSAANNFRAAQEYFYTIHHRSSFDGSNSYARANVHEGTNYVNAYWDGTDFHFGDGDGSEASELGVLDVCGHEFTHAVTENSADLYYYGEPGALNESFSDIFAASVEFYAQPDGGSSYPSKIPGYADWLIGEDCWLDGTALRDMRDPGSTVTLASGYQQPSRYHGSDWYFGSSDNGGVHYNGGPQSFFFYLLCEGGAGTNDGISYSVTGIGITNAEQVAFRALTVYCTEYTDYSEARSAWLSAALDLDADWATSVQNAWIAVGVENEDISGTDLGFALDAPLLTWFTGGASNWYVQSTVTHDGTEAVQSGNIGNGEQSRLYTTVTGPGRLWFCWKVSSEANYDFLRFYIDETEQTKISGSNDWQNLSYSLSAGDHTLKWQYTKDELVRRGSDAGWLDQVVLIATPTNSEGMVWNDFDGDGASDLAVYHETTGNWYIWSIQNGLIAWNFAWGGSGFMPIAGDYDGDGMSDLAVFESNTGYWFIYSLTGNVIAWAVQWGWPGLTPVAGDYSGDGVSDLALYDTETGCWYAITLSGNVIVLGESWIGTGFGAVPGDYNGDGVSDYAMYHESLGYWYIISVDGSSIIWGTSWGGSGYTPVTGDYDGDDISDLAVYYEVTGQWFIWSHMTGTSIVFGTAWGGSGFAPVQGDYNGDGISDMAVYHQDTGTWYIQSADGSEIILYGMALGGPDFVPIRSTW